MGAEADPEPPPRRGDGPVGVFLVGAFGQVATTVVLGARAIAQGLAAPTGLVTALPAFEGAGLPPLGALRFGGAEVRPGSFLESARSLAAEGVVPAALVEALAPELGALSAHVGPGVATGLSARSGERRLVADGPRHAIALLSEAIGAFARAVEVERVVVCHVASVEPRHEEAESVPTEAALEALLDRGDPSLPPSLLYALAAFEAGASYLNFTPCCGASAPAVRARAARLGLPHAGRDGKTGETLLKSALAPMFRDRHLRVLSWAGFNILGNRDGEVLSDPAAREAKLRTKRSVLSSVLGPSGLGTEHVRIDYVPSLGDWKTAWDHVHFQGFLGTKMALELTWRGCDSALAAPLVLDVTRLLARLHAVGIGGCARRLAAFFKDPLEVTDHDFSSQMALLRGLAAELRETG